MSSGWRQCLNPSHCRSCSGWLDCHCSGRVHYRAEKDSRRIPDPLNPDGTRTLKKISTRCQSSVLGCLALDWQNKVHSGPTPSSIERSQTLNFNRFSSLILESRRGPFVTSQKCPICSTLFFLRTLLLSGACKITSHNWLNSLTWDTMSLENALLFEVLKCCNDVGATRLKKKKRIPMIH